MAGERISADLDIGCLLIGLASGWMRPLSGSRAELLRPGADQFLAAVAELPE